MLRLLLSLVLNDSIAWFHSGGNSFIQKQFKCIASSKITAGKDSPNTLIAKHDLFLILRGSNFYEKYSSSMYFWLQFICMAI